MKTKRILAAILSLIMVMSILPISAFASGEATPKTVFDLKKINSEEDLPAWFAQNYASNGTEKAISASIENGVLTVENGDAAFGMVNLFDYANAKTAGNAFTVSMTFALKSHKFAWIETNDAIRGGICFNVGKGAVTGTWVAINSKSICQYQKYTAGSGKTENENMPASTANNGVYTVSVFFAGDGSFTYEVTDAYGNLMFETAAAKTTDFAVAPNFGVYCRNAIVVVTDYTIVEGGKRVDSALSDSKSEYSDVYDPKNGDIIFNLEDYSTTDDLPAWFAQSYSSKGVANELQTTFENGVLTVTNTASSFGTVNLYNYADAAKEGNIYDVSMTFTMASIGNTWKASSNAVRGGLCYNVAEGGLTGHWSIIRSDSTAQMQGYKNQTSAQDVNVKNSATITENTEYTLRMIFAGDGSYTFFVYDAEGSLLSTQTGTSDFANGKNFGVFSRYSTVKVTAYQIREYNNVNATRYIGTQSPAKSAIGDTYAIRLIGGVQSLNAYQVGMKVTVSYGEKSKTVDYKVNTVYTGISGTDENGMTVGYTAKYLSANYLMAVGFKGIPTNAGNVTFTVVPYHVLGGKTVEAQGYTVVYNAGVLVSQTAIAG